MSRIRNVLALVLMALAAFAGARVHAAPGSSHGDSGRFAVR